MSTKKKLESLRHYPQPAAWVSSDHPLMGDNHSHEHPSFANDMHRRHLQKMLRCFHVTHAIVLCAATPATPDAIQMLPKQFLHCIVRERETRSAHSVRLQFLRNIFSLVCRLALQIWNLQLPRAVLLRAVFMILNWNCAQQLGHYPLAQSLSNLKSHRLLVFFNADAYRTQSKWIYSCTGLDQQLHPRTRNYHGSTH